MAAYRRAALSSSSIARFSIPGKSACFLTGSLKSAAASSGFPLMGRTDFGFAKLLPPNPCGKGNRLADGTRALWAEILLLMPKQTHPKFLEDWLFICRAL